MNESPRDKMDDKEAEHYDRLMKFSKEMVVADCVHLAEHNASFRARIRHVWEEIDMVNEALENPNIDHQLVLKEFIKAVTDALNWVWKD